MASICREGFYLMNSPSLYEIRIEDHLTDSWSGWFDGLTIENVPDGVTILSGEFVDQAALFGVLSKIQALNLTLISVNRLPFQKQE
jgi:hypothetical protein